MTALRRTKIVATLGPATNKPGVLESIIKGGVDVVRLNFSHGDHEAHGACVARIKEAMKQRPNKTIGIALNRGAGFFNREPY